MSERHSKMTCSRRSFIAGAASLPFIGARADPPADFDVVVVGAGVAGIAASSAVRAAGLTALVLEARDRIGGRACTDVETLGAPFDLGAMWFHSAEKNPLCPLARARGVALEASDFEDIELRKAGVPVATDFAGALSRGEDDITRSAFWKVLLRIDASLASVANSPSAKVAAQSEALQCAAPESELSIIDVAALEGGGNLIPESGMGSFVSDLGRDIPVRLRSPVAALDLSARAVRVQGEFGTVTARACILTVPTSLIDAGSITFTPALPADIRAAFAALPMGLMLKVGLRMREPVRDAREFTAVSSGGPVAVVRLDKSRQLATVITGGQWAKDVSAGGRAAKESFARDALRDAFGASASAGDRIIATAWDEEIYSRGSYAHASIGHHGARRVYDRHVGERLFFAGEAGGREYAMTVGGAWLSGRRAAAMAVKALR
jgi:monoamine oxidase